MREEVVVALRLDPGDTTAKAKQVEQAYKQIGETAGASARQTANAMRQLPAQFTDVFTSLAGGQNPLLVLIQQGGQIKDSFGGAGAALRGVAAAISPAVIGVGALAGVVAVLGSRWSQASSEQRDFERGLALSGNRLELTTGQLQEMARVLGQGGNRGQAASAFLTMAKDSRVAATDLQDLTGVALRLQRVGGPSVDDTAKRLAALAKDPLDAVRELGAELGFLTPKLYDQVRALTEQGRQFEAGQLAQQAFARNMTQVTSALGETEGALDKVSRKAGDMWDALADPFRARTAVERLVDLQKQLANNRARGFGDANPYGLGSPNQGLLDQQRDLNRSLFSQFERSSEARTARELASRFATARSELDKLADAGKSAAERFDVALKRLRENTAFVRAQGGQVTSAQQAAAEKALRQQIFGGGSGRVEKVGQVDLEILDPRDYLARVGMAREKEASRIEGFFAQQVFEQEQRDKKLFDSKADARAKAFENEVKFLEDLNYANQRAGIELIEDEEKRGRALIELDRQIALKRLEAMGFGEGAQAEGRNLINQQASLAIDKLGAKTGESIYGDVRNALAAAFQDSHNPAKAFANALGNAIFTRTTARLADALATAAVGKDGTGGFWGDILSSVGDLFGPGKGYTVDTNGRGINLPDDYRPSKLATGTNFVPQDMLAFLHAGEAVVPRRYNPAAGGNGGGGMVQNITYMVPAGASPAAYAAMLQDNNRRLKAEMAADLARPGRALNGAALAGQG